MTDYHPITPPPELFKQWEDDILNGRDNVDHVLNCAWRDGFRAGADQELEACCEWLAVNSWKTLDSRLRAARRPKPLSLKEQALAIIDDRTADYLDDNALATIRRALEQLDD